MSRCSLLLSLSACVMLSRAVNGQSQILLPLNQCNCDLALAGPLLYGGTHECGAYIKGNECQSQMYLVDDRYTILL